MNTQTNLTDVQARLAAIGFKQDRRLGMSVLSLAEGETVIVKIKGEPFELTAKDGRVFDAVMVDNLETGESDQTMWLSGQLTNALKSQEDGFIGGAFAITHKGKIEAEVLIDGKKQKTKVNNFDIIALKTN